MISIKEELTLFLEQTWILMGVAMLQIDSCSITEHGINSGQKTDFPKHFIEGCLEKDSHC